MGPDLRRGARRACLVAAGICALFAVAMPSSPAEESDTVPPPEVFRGSASAVGVSVQVDREALLPIPELLRFIALDGASTYESSTRQARASLLFPGNGLILGPGLACGTFGGQFPAEFKPILDTCLQYKYPLTVFADDFEPDGATSGSLALGAPNDPVSGNAIRAKAHAAEDAATTDAVIQDLRVLGVPPFGPVTPQLPGFEMDTSLLTVDSATSRTDQRIVRGGLVVDAESTLSDIRLFGGLIRIESLHSVSRVTDDANGKRTAVPSLTVGGITVGGQPAKLTQDGLVVGSSGSGPLDQQAQAAVNEALRAMGITFTILDSTQSLQQDGAAVANVGGLLIEFRHDVQGLPTTPRFPDPRFPNTEADPNGVYKGSIQLGATGALGSAVNFPTEVIGGDGDTTFDNGGAGFDPGTTGFDGGDSFDGGLPGEVDSGTAPPPTTRRPATGTEGTQLARSIGGIFGDRLGLLYLSLAFAVLGCCVAPAFTLPARFPGRSS
ncbi:MAG: choice-of-anchor P family protein [Microthrixaceae bacterium]